MKNMIFSLAFVVTSLSSAYAGGAPTEFARASVTPTGIPLDSPWKEEIYSFALKNVVHPSWGIAHSERNYQVTLRLAAADHVPMDLDVLFAASFLHDLGGMEGFEKEGVDHAVRSVEVIEPLVKGWGFPMQKWPALKDMILGHIYYGPAPQSPASQAFRDADILDFLGTLGVARILAITEEKDGPRSVLKSTVNTLRSFATTLPGKVSLGSSQKIAKERAEEMTIFLRSLDEASFQGKAL